MRAVVTGVAGFIGSHVAEVLIARGDSVLGIDDLSGGMEGNVPRGVQFCRLSVLDHLDAVLTVFRPEAVYHLAAYAAEGLSHHIPRFNYENNLIGTANVLTSAYRAEARHFVFTSSIAAYGHPKGDAPFGELDACEPCDPYGAAKLCCEHHIKAFHGYYGRPSYTIFRPHNVFGPRQNIADPYRNVVGIFMQRVCAGLPMPIFGDGTQTRSFSYVSTVARCIALAPFVHGALNKTINIGGDRPLSVNDLAVLVARVMGKPLRVERLPERHEVKHAHCRHDLARSIFQEEYCQEVELEEGLRRMAEDVLSHSIPEATECPSDIEIPDKLPPSWAQRPNSHIRID